MNESTMSYDNAYAVYELLQTIDHSIGVQSATTLHFIIPVDQQVNALSPQAMGYIEQLTQDHLLYTFDLHTTIQQYCERYQNLEQWTQELKALQARQKTLSLRLRNLEKEQNKAGLFKGKMKQELAQQIKKTQQSYGQSQTQRQYIEDQLTQLEHTRRNIASMIQQNEQLQNAKWLTHEKRVLALTDEGQFLLSYLREMKSEVMVDKPLSYILLYGHQWSQQQS